MKIYFAGPLFTPYERDYISACARVLREHGIDPFVPHEGDWVDDPTDTRSRAKRCLDKDFGGISGANAMVALINGAEIDDGTACEIGIFHSLMKQDPTKKGIVALHDDWRTREGGEGKGINSFVLGCLREIGVICTDLDAVVDQLAAWKTELQTEGLLADAEAS
jgi:nucleoside 2-deoxyribosyltransferase-like protein